MDSNPLQVLMVEDRREDAELIRRELTRAGLNFVATRVDTETDFRNALAIERPDVILADYALPLFSGSDALEIARSSAPETPFIFVSGSIGEESAVNALRNGASDYILKDRLSRLPSAISRALDEREERRRRSRAEDALRLSEERFHHAVRATRDVIWDWDVRSGRVWANEALLAEWGHELKSQEVSIEWWREQIHAEDLPVVMAVIDDCLATHCANYAVGYRLRRGNGSWGEGFDRALVIYDEQGEAIRIIGAIQDVTDRLAAKQTIRALSHQNDLILRYAVEGIVGVDARGKAWFANPAALAALGRVEADVGSRETVHELLCGDERSRLPHSREDCPLLQTLHDGAVRTGETVFVQKDGSEIDVEYNCSPMFEGPDGFYGSVITFENVTRRKRLERQVQNAERVSSLGKLSATVAHEFNNVLMGIQPFAEVIRARTSNDEKLQKAAHQILNSVSRGRQVTQEILRIANPGTPTMQSVDACEWLLQTGVELKTVLGDSVQVVVDVPAEPVYVSCDAGQLQQVVTNLAFNSRDAMPEGGVLSLSARADDGRVRIEVRDTGVGMPPHILERIFEPLYTTKRLGTGIGLAVAEQMVVRNQGTIAVSSVVGSGTTFTISLPGGEAAKTAPPPAATRKQTVSRILLVEDEAAVSAGIMALLEMEGFEVRVAERASEVMGQIDSFEPQLVVVDMGLPDADGASVFDLIRTARPNLPVLFSSGHFQPSLMERFASTPGVGFLQKPYDLSTLLAELERLSR